MTPKEKKAFKTEIDAMIKFKSPFIVKLLEAFEQNDHFYLATKYANGGSLDKHLETYHNKKLPIDEAVRFFTMICLGLNYIHIKGFVHRDISPKNLFLENKEQGEGKWLLVGDLGLAKNLSD